VNRAQIHAKHKLRKRDTHDVPMEASCARPEAITQIPIQPDTQSPPTAAKCPANHVRHFATADSFFVFLPCIAARKGV
jgi:hypothetical protein